jgi:hypothetical protein
MARGDGLEAGGPGVRDNRIRHWSEPLVIAQTRGFQCSGFSVQPIRRPNDRPVKSKKKLKIFKEKEEWILILKKKIRPD